MTSLIIIVHVTICVDSSVGMALRYWLDGWGFLQHDLGHKNSFFLLLLVLAQLIPNSGDFRPHLKCVTLVIGHCLQFMCVNTLKPSGCRMYHLL
jgi:hypothetical protein